MVSAAESDQTGLLWFYTVAHVYEALHVYEDLHVSVCVF